MAEQHFGGFHPPAGNPFGTLANDIIYTGIAAHGASRDLKRNEVLIENARIMRPEDRSIAVRNVHSSMKDILLSIKYLRKFQAQKIVIDRMNMLARTYGNSIRVTCDTPPNEIQDQIDRLNMCLPKKYESEITRSFDQNYDRTRKKEYKEIEGFIQEASIKFRTFEDRSKILHLYNSRIDEMKNLLHGHEFHNFNVNAIFAGYIIPERGYVGLLPDPVDAETINILVSQTNNMQNNNTNTNNMQNNNTNTNNMQNNNTNTNNNTNSNASNTSAQSIDDDIENFSVTPNQHFAQSNSYNNSSYTR